MNAFTFDSIYSVPPAARRARARNTVRPQAAPVQQLPNALALHPHSGPLPKANKIGLTGLFVVAAIAHTALFWVARHGEGTVAPLKAAHPLAMEFAPPPPPPPPPKEPEPPKPRPQLAKSPTPAPVKAPPVNLPQAVADGPATADSVQVAPPSPPAPPAPTPASPAPPAPEPVTEPRGFAGYKSNPPPDYPAMAQDRGQQGQVVLKVHVLASGKPDAVTVEKSTGFKILDDAAVKAVLSWVFDPARRGSTPIDGWVKVPLSFKL